MHFSLLFHFLVLKFIILISLHFLYFIKLTLKSLFIFNFQKVKRKLKIFIPNFIKILIFDSKFQISNFEFQISNFVSNSEILKFYFYFYFILFLNFYFQTLNFKFLNFLFKFQNFSNSRFFHYFASN